MSARRAEQGPACGGWTRALGSAAALLALLVGVASVARAQTPVTSLGLGYPVPPLDARAAAMGGTGLGLLGGSLSAVNPAEMAAFRRPSLGLTFSAERVGVETGSGSQSTGRSRIPNVRAVIPFRSWAFGLSFSSVSDQDWSIRLQDTLVSSSGTFPYDERREHDGGLSTVNFSVARELGPVSLGVEAGILTGSLRQTFFRNFEPSIENPGVGIGVARGESRFSYSGLRVRGGVAAQLSPRLRLSGVLSFSGDLEAKQDTAGQQVARYEIPMPAEWAFGGSYQVAPRFLVSAAGGWAAWSNTGNVLESSEAVDTWWVGGGAEYVGLTLFGASVPLRAGYRRTGLPFHPVGEEPLTESAFSFGVGFDVAGGLSSVDLSVEIGSRGDFASSGAEESFTRFSLSLALYQL